MQGKVFPYIQTATLTIDSPTVANIINILFSLLRRRPKVRLTADMQSYQFGSTAHSLSGLFMEKLVTFFHYLVEYCDSRLLS